FSDVHISFADQRIVKNFQLQTCKNLMQFLWNGNKQREDINNRQIALKQVIQMGSTIIARIEFVPRATNDNENNESRIAQN
ncbi:9522_t:CDS:1, partial [Gigaspora rosea]